MFLHNQTPHWRQLIYAFHHLEKLKTTININDSKEYIYWYIPFHIYIAKVSKCLRMARLQCKALLHEQNTYDQHKHQEESKCKPTKDPSGINWNLHDSIELLHQLFQHLLKNCPDNTMRKNTKVYYLNNKWKFIITPHALRKEEEKPNYCTPPRTQSQK